MSTSVVPRQGANDPLPTEIRSHVQGQLPGSTHYVGSMVAEAEVKLEFYNNCFIELIAIDDATPRGNAASNLYYMPNADNSSINSNVLGTSTAMLWHASSNPVLTVRLTSGQKYITVATMDGETKTIHLFARILR